MFNFLFGFAWTAFVTLIFIVWLVAPGEQIEEPGKKILIFSF